MNYAGIDIGSTSAKAVVIDDDKNILHCEVCPTGWSSAETAEKIRVSLLEQQLINETTKFVATGYGRVSVKYAGKTVTEISCHGQGAAQIFDNGNCAVLDIGGQDTKIILLAGGKVKNFIMNDKCSAGTGRFLEIMANTLGLGLNDLFTLARTGKPTPITSMCTVFAESEVISLIGQGTPKEDIAYGVVDSIISKVHSQCGRLIQDCQHVYLTGGLCEADYILEQLSKHCGKKVISSPMGRYAGALGAPVGFGVGRQAVSLPVPLKGEPEVVGRVAGEIVFIDQIPAGVVGRVDADHFYPAAIARPQKL